MIIFCWALLHIGMIKSIMWQNILSKGNVFVVFITLIVNLGFGKLAAQDIHFTQFDFNPLFLNAANTGNFRGDMRIAGIYRNQGKSTSTPYSTASISFDKQLYVFNQKMGLGGLFINDESGTGGLTFNQLFASAGYNSMINNNSIGFGLQVGYVFGKVNSWAGYDPSTGTYTAPNGETMSDYNTSYLDINFGINYKRSINIFEPEVGFSMQHINKPVNSFNENNTEKESVRYLAYSTVKTNLSDKFYLTPKFLYSGQNATSEIILGTAADYSLIGMKSSVKKIFIGGYMRAGTSGFDAVMSQVGASIGRIDLAISYDLYLSDVTQTGNTGAFEISFIYKSISTLLNSYSIPCERY
jgi:type IX secretion system PorP/SprF family membrane protein